MPDNPDLLRILNEEIITCRKCRRLVRYREKVAREKRRAFREWTYWGKPVPGFGDAHAQLLILGLAPAAHGANRTGRMFTGDRSGDFLYAALDNKPLPEEISNCRSYLERELEILKPKAILALGKIAWDGYLEILKLRGVIASRGLYKFAHGAEAEVAPSAPRLFGVYHPSQQNTQTGRVTPAMYAAVLRRIRRFLEK